MRFAGLAGWELALAASIASLIVLLLYLLRRPTRIVATPALFLWERIDPARKRASALFSRLRRVLSLLLALAIALLLVFALSDPTASRGGGRSLLLVIDQSASMAAHDVQPSRLAQAKERARAIVRTLQHDDRALVASLAGSIVPRTPLTNEAALLLAAIDDVAQTDAAASFEAAADLAIDALPAGGEVIVLSDGNLPDFASESARLERARLRVQLEVIGRGSRNVAVTQFAARNYPLDKRHFESLVVLTNFGERRERGTLRIFAQGALLYEQPFELAPHGSETRVWSELPTTADMLEARIALAAGPDLLASDDRAFAAVPARARTRVLSVSESNRYLEAALLLDEYLDVRELAPAAFAGAQGYDVVIFDRVLPREPPGVPALYLGAPNGSGHHPLALRGTVERPFFERVRREHPLVRGLALSDVNVARAASVSLAAGDVAVAESERAPLLIEGTRDGLPFVALPFDVRESDLPLRPAWPLLLLRAIDRLVGDDSVAPQVRVAGEAFELALPRGVTKGMLRAPDGKRTAVAAAVTRQTFDRAGPYHLELPGRAPLAFAVQVPAAQEGAIAPARAGAATPHAAAPRLSFLEGRWWPLLAACALFLALFEWLAFHRRWTV